MWKGHFTILPIVGKITQPHLLLSTPIYFMICPLCCSPSLTIVWCYHIRVLYDVSFKSRLQVGLESFSLWILTAVVNNINCGKLCKKQLLSHHPLFLREKKPYYKNLIVKINHFAGFSMDKISQKSWNVDRIVKLGWMCLYVNEKRV